MTISGNTAPVENRSMNKRRHKLAVDPGLFQRLKFKRICYIITMCEALNGHTNSKTNREGRITEKGGT
jgi:hypothetical protein